PVAEVGAQLSLFDELPVGPPERGWQLPELVPVPAPPLHKVRQLSYSALALFQRCSYRFYAERVAGLRERPRAGRDEGLVDGGGEGLAATEIGDAVHRLLELVDLADPRVPDLSVVSQWYPGVTPEELERIEAFTASYCDSALARRVAGLAGAR